MSWRVRALGPGDGEALALLHRRAILATSTRFYSTGQLASWAAGLRPEAYAAAPGGWFDVVTADDRVVAFCDQSGEDIRGLYVDPDWHGRGIGTALVRLAEDRMRTAGVSVAKVHSALSSRSFYERCGFHVTGFTEHPTRGGLVLPSVRLHKPIG